MSFCDDLRRFSIGVDPGNSAAIARVCRSRAGAAAELLGGWSIYGAPAPRARRELEALQAMSAICTDEQDFFSIRIELPAAGGASANRTGWQLAVGRSIGWYEAVLQTWFVTRPEMVKANVWPRLVGVRCGKKGDGLHRVQEARVRLVGADCLVAGMEVDTIASRERRVARAEACLIALAGLKS